MKYKYILIAIIILSQCSTATAWLTGYDYRMPIQINNTGVNLSNYTYSFTVDTAALVAAGKMQADGDDCRITNATDILQPFWNETAFNASNTKIWVNAATLGNLTNTTHYMYYANSGASSVANGVSTFELFDDFVDNSTIEADQVTKRTVYDSTRYAMAPSMIKLHDGTLFAIISEGDAHASENNFDVKWMNSTNNGTTWSSPQIVAAHDGIEDARNAGCLEFNNSGVWTILTYYDRQTTTYGDVFCKKSTDGGVTWGSEINVTNSTHQYTYGAGTQLVNGDLIFASYTYTFPTIYECEAQVSTDGGDTWTEYEITTGNAVTETSIIEKADAGHVLALIRKHLADEIWSSNSTDYGRTWSTPNVTALSDAEDAPMSAIRLTDGNMLASWERSITDFRTMLSDDDGATWEAGSASIYSDASMPHAAGYLSSVQINDSHIFSLWYIEHATGDADVYGNFVPINVIWTQVGSPTLSYSNGILRIYGSDNSDNRLISSKTFSAPHILGSRSKLDWTGTNCGQLGFGVFRHPLATGVEYAVFKDSSAGNNNATAQNANETSTKYTSGANMDSYFINEIKWKSDEIKYINTHGTTTHTASIPSDSLSVAIGGHGYLDSAFEVYLDWLFVRQYAATEPTTAMGAEDTALAHITIPSTAWFYTFLIGANAMNVSTIKASIDADGLDCYALYRWNGTSYVATGDVKPCEGIIVYCNNTGEWTI